MRVGKAFWSRQPAACLDPQHAWSCSMLGQQLRAAVPRGSRWYSYALHGRLLLTDYVPQVHYPDELAVGLHRLEITRHTSPVDVTLNVTRNFLVCPQETGWRGTSMQWFRISTSTTSRSPRLSRAEHDRMFKGIDFTLYSSDEARECILQKKRHHRVGNVRTKSCGDAGSSSPWTRLDARRCSLSRNSGCREQASDAHLCCVTYHRSI